MEITHIDEKGNARMVDVSGKCAGFREAIAAGKVYMSLHTISKITCASMPKGDVLAVARVAGITAAKRTSELIPMCHNIPLDLVKLDFDVDTENCCIKVSASVGCTWKTGVEMEALTAVSAAALTIYDMCKAVDKNMIISEIHLIKKTGGKSGDFSKKG